MRYKFDFSPLKLKYNWLMEKLLLILFLITLIAIGIINKDIFLFLKVLLYGGFWWSIIGLTKFLSRDFTDGRKNDFFGE